MTAVLCQKCGIAIREWRSCPITGCLFIAAYCIACGGETEAVSDMIAHLSVQHGQEPPNAA